MKNKTTSTDKDNNSGYVGLDKQTAFLLKKAITGNLIETNNYGLAGISAAVVDKPNDSGVIPPNNDYLVRVWCDDPELMLQPAVNKQVRDVVGKFRDEVTVGLKEGKTQRDREPDGLFWEIDTAEAGEVKSLADVVRRAGIIPAPLLFFGLSSITTNVERVHEDNDWTVHDEPVSRLRHRSYRFSDASREGDDDDGQFMVEFVYGNDRVSEYAHEWLGGVGFISMAAGDFRLGSASLEQRDSDTVEPEPDPGSCVTLPRYSKFRAVSVTGPFTDPTVTITPKKLQWVFRDAVSRTESAIEHNQNMMRLASLVPWDDWRDIEPSDVIRKHHGLPDSWTYPLQHVNGISRSHTERFAQTAGTFKGLSDMVPDDISGKNGLTRETREEAIELVSFLDAVRDEALTNSGFEFERVHLRPHMTNYPKPHPPGSVYDGLNEKDVPVPVFAGHHVFPGA